MCPHYSRLSCGNICRPWGPFSWETKAAPVPSCIIQALPDKIVQHMVFSTANWLQFLLKIVLRDWILFSSGWIKNLPPLTHFLWRFNNFLMFTFHACPLKSSPIFTLTILSCPMILLIPSLFLLSCLIPLLIPTLIPYTFTCSSSRRTTLPPSFVLHILYYHLINSPFATLSQLLCFYFPPIVHYPCLSLSSFICTYSYCNFLHQIFSHPWSH